MINTIINLPSIFRYHKNRNCVKYAKIRVFTYPFVSVSGQICSYTRKNGSEETRILADFTHWAALPYLHLNFWSIELSEVLTRSCPEENCSEKCFKIQKKAPAIESYFSKVTKPSPAISTNRISVHWWLLGGVEKRETLYFSRKSAHMFRKSCHFAEEIC